MHTVGGYFCINLPISSQPFTSSSNFIHDDHNRTVFPPRAKGLSQSTFHHQMKTLPKLTQCVSLNVHINDFPWGEWVNLMNWPSP